MSGETWRHEVEVYAAAGMEQPTWSEINALGLCPMVCPDHARHCARGLPHETHACAMCERS